MQQLAERYIGDERRLNKARDRPAIPSVLADRSERRRRWVARLRNSDRRAHTTPPADLPKRVRSRVDAQRRTSRAVPSDAPYLRKYDQGCRAPHPVAEPG